MKSYGVRVYNAQTGNIRHISGEWENADAMINELVEDGFIILCYWKEG